MRDCRITMIYEGTNGIQAMDLLGRKLGMNQGKPVMDLIGRMRLNRLIPADIPELQGLEERKQSLDAGASLALRGHEATVNAVFISPDRRWVVTGSADGNVRFWDLEVDSLVERARRLAGRELTWEERKQYMVPTHEL